MSSLEPAASTVISKQEISKYALGDVVLCLDSSQFPTHAIFDFDARITIVEDIGRDGTEKHAGAFTLAHSPVTPLVTGSMLP